jgi:hypothetical protein
MHSGSCLCGAVHYEFDGDVGPLVFCHCSRCRKAQGGALAAVVPVATSTFRITAGVESLGDYVAPSGLHRRFCRNCGSPIFTSRENLPDVVRVRVGTLDTPLAKGGPDQHIFVGSKADWDHIHDDAPQHLERA